MNSNYHLIVSCPDQRGIVAAVSSFIAKHGGLIVEADQHTDIENQWFFMRYEIAANTLSLSVEAFNHAFATIAASYQMQYQFHDASVKKRVLVLASKQTHCLEDLLYRWQSKELQCEVIAVASNHEDLRKRTEWYELPYHYLPITTRDKAAHFTAIADLITEHRADLIVLARYMQVLPAQLCQQYHGKIINIHHSFLPSFIGAKPYHQAYQRGVKLIGATAHYATADLDEGPIITQDVVTISHRQSLADYIRLGKDIERNVLARAVKAHLEDRVIIYQHKTVVFA